MFYIALAVFLHLFACVASLLLGVLWAEYDENKEFLSSQETMKIIKAGVFVVIVNSLLFILATLIVVEITLE